MVMTLLPATAFADDAQTELDISKGDITIGEGTVSGKDKDWNEVTAPDAAGYRIIGYTNEHTITVNGGAHNITLADMEISCGGNAMHVTSGTVNLKLEGIISSTAPTTADC